MHAASIPPPSPLPRIAPFWHGGCDDVRASIVAAGGMAAQFREIAAGEPLFLRGEAMRSVFAVMSGVVEVMRGSGRKASKIADIVLGGDMLGFDDFAAGMHGSDAVAVNDVLVATIDPADWGRQAARDPALPTLSALAGSQLVRAFRQNMRLRLNAAARLADFVLQLSEKWGLGDAPLILPLSFQDVANYLELRPETMSRVVRSLESMQCFRREGRSLFAIDPVRLRTTRATRWRRQV